MKNKKPILLISFLTLLALFLLAGCQTIVEKAANKAVEKSTGVSVDEKNNKIKFKNKSGEGEIQVNKNKLPDGFPKKFPIFKGAKITSSAKTKSGKNVNYYVSWTSGADSKTVAKYYKKELPKNGYQIKESLESPQNTVYTLDKSSTIAIGTEKGKTVITVILVEK